MVTVKVVRKDSGKPARDRKVSLYLQGSFLGMGGGVTKNVYTDSEGEAHFEVESSSGEIYVDGVTRHQGRLAGRVVVYV
jgi:hypothetical protein